MWTLGIGLERKPYSQAIVFPEPFRLTENRSFYAALAAFAKIGDAPRMKPSSLAATLTLLFAMFQPPLSAQTSLALAGSKWTVVAIQGTPIIPTSNVKLEFGPDDTVTGNTGVNGFSGAVQIDGSKIQFDRLRSTRRAASEELMSQETSFNRALADSAQFTITPDGFLLLQSDSGTETLRCSPVRAE